MSSPLSIRVGLWVWFLVAAAVGYSGVLLKLPLPAMQGILLVLTAAALVAARRLPALRAWLEQVDLRVLLLLHLTRFVGFYFILLYRQGRLPYDFAVRGGAGDIVVATGALLLCVLPLGAAARRHGITIWNVVGSIDILFVIFTAARLAWQGEWHMRALEVMPLSLLPTFLVPLIVTTHVVIFLRLRKDSGAVAP
jgi:hypothetical protein